METNLQQGDLPGAYSAFTGVQLEEWEIDQLLQPDATLYADVPGLLAAAGFGDVTVSPADLNAYLQSLATNGFPAQEVQIFEELGLSIQDITELADQLGDLNVNGGPFSLYDSLLEVSEIDSEISDTLPNLSVVPTNVPEPSSLAILGSAVIGFLMRRRRAAS
jgi:PEP-CTERM motif